jgi:hypothetical protein
MSIEEAIGHLKVVDDDEPQPLSGTITVSGKLHLTREQWEACQCDGKKGGVLSLDGWPQARQAVQGAPRLGHEDVPRVAPVEAPMVMLPTTRSHTR